MIKMNPINASLAGTSVSPRSPRPPRSPRIQQRASPRNELKHQVSTTSSKAENGQLTTNNSERSVTNSHKKDTLSENKNKESKKKEKKCLVM